MATIHVNNLSFSLIRFDGFLQKLFIAFKAINRPGKASRIQRWIKLL